MEENMEDYVCIFIHFDKVYLPFKTLFIDYLVSVQDLLDIFHEYFKDIFNTEMEYTSFGSFIQLRWDNL